MRRRRIIVLVLLGVMGLIALGLLGFSSAQDQREPISEIPATISVEVGDVVQSIDAPGRLVGTKEVLLGMDACGTLEEIFVKPGDAVDADQPLAILGDEEKFLAAVTQAKEEVASAKNAIQEIINNAPLVTAQAQMDLVKAQEELQQTIYKNLILQEGNRASSATLEAAKAKLALAEDEVKRAEQEYKKLSGRSENDPIRASAQLRFAEAIQRRDSALRALNWYTGHPTELQQAKLDSEIDIAEAKLLIAEITWDRVKDGPDPEILAEAEQHLARAETQLAEAEAELTGMTLNAPFAGVILEVNAKPGDSMTAGVGFIVLSDLTAIEVTASVIEEDFPQIQIGQSVELFFDARPDVEIIGKVKRIVPKRLPGDRPLYAVYISFDDVPNGLVPGMTADACIITAIRENVFRLPKSLVRSHSDGTAKVEVWTDGHREERIVQVGLRGDSYVEILTGLKVGDLVVAE